MRAGISDAEIFITATNDDMINLLGAPSPRRFTASLSVKGTLPGSEQ